jgi:hypothetical protein
MHPAATLIITALTPEWSRSALSHTIEPTAWQHLFSEDEMRRPTLNAVPCSGLQLSTSSKRAQWKEDRPMNDGSRETPMVTAGLDLGDNYTYLCLLNIHSGEVLEEGRLRTTPEAFTSGALTLSSSHCA